MRVAICASGGLSHIRVDAALDLSMLRAIERRDLPALADIPAEKLLSGNGQLRPWLVAAGAMFGLNMELLEYSPCYRSLAGTGSGMAFACWN